MSETESGHKQTLIDREGRQAEVFIYRNIIFPGIFPELFNPEKHLKSIKRFQYRHGDILQCAFPKSGNHWLSNIMTLLLSKDSDMSTASVNVNLLDLSRPIERLNTKSSPRIITSHMKYKHLPDEHFEKCGKVILLVRNPKDVAVSFYHHGRRDKILNICLSWESFLKYFLEGKLPFGSYFDYLMNWQEVLELRKDLQIHIVYYEDLKQRTLYECKKLQEYLGVYNTDERLQQIIRKCSFNSLKSDVESGKVKTMLKDGDNKPFLYRKGKIGDWMNHFTVAQNNMFDDVIKRKLKDCRFQFRYSQVSPCRL